MNVIVISGGTKGIGRAIAELFLEQNFKVYISARNPDLSFEHPNLDQYKCDMSIKEETKAFAKHVLKHEKTVDVLINNVGVFLPGSLISEDEENFETQINTNLSSTYHLTRALIGAIRESNHPYIFNICSTASVTPYMNGGSYCISKYAQLGFTKVLREELKPEKIKVSAVLPGATLTNSWAGTDLPDSRFMEAKSIAQIIFTAYQLKDSTVLEEIVMRPMEGDI